MTPCYYCEADDDACKTCIHSDTYIDPQEEITKLREQVAAQSAVIEKLHAICDMWLWETVNERKEHADARKQTQEALAIPTDSTQILEQYVKEKTQAQAAVIEKLREALQYYANQSSYCNCDGCEQLRYEFGSETQHAIFALSIPTDSTQVLAEVRKQERERVYQVADNAYATEHVLLAIRAME